MRLLNTWTLGIEEFYDHIPPYAILSHTWGSSELTFQDWQSGNAHTLPGYQKIKDFVRLARHEEFGYVWADTICIDKTNSTELFEAINSMFRWYAESAKCYAYLSDTENLQDLYRSRWFRRGWTLQELLAPSYLEFYNAAWTFLGNKGELHRTLRDITGIPERALMTFKPEDWTIAERMSWARDRETKRKEDIAYSLLGIFAVNIPLLYGEGDRAFLRLQEEIMRVSDDQSLFAWVEKNAIRESPCGLLATSPSNFTCNALDSVQWFPGFTDETIYMPYSLTNRGIQIQLSMLPFGPDHPRTYYAILGYGTKEDRAAIVVKHLVRNEYARVHADTLIMGEIPSDNHFGSRYQDVVIRQRAPMLRPSFAGEYSIIWLEYSRLRAHNISLNHVLPTHIFSPSDSVLRFDTKSAQSLVYFRYGPTGQQFTLRVDKYGECKLKAKEHGPDRTRSSFQHHSYNTGASKIFFVTGSDHDLIITARSILENPTAESGKFFTVILEAHVVPDGTEISFTNAIILMTALLGTGVTTYACYTGFLRYNNLHHQNLMQYSSWSNVSAITLVSVFAIVYILLWGGYARIGTRARALTKTVKSFFQYLWRMTTENLSRTPR